MRFPFPDYVNVTPCTPSPCGPNSQCREINSQAVCSCRDTFIGIPPNCRPECTINSECATDKACVNRKCVNPCRDQCGKNANCRVIAHNPMCSCQEHYTGDPFSYCMPGIYKLTIRNHSLYLTQMEKYFLNYTFTFRANVFTSTRT